jgi:hypothetical protein
MPTRDVWKYRIIPMTNRDPDQSALCGLIEGGENEGAVGSYSQANVFEQNYWGCNKQAIQLFNWQVYKKLES